MEDVENLDVKTLRKGLFNNLDHVLEVSTKKFNREKASNADRQKWGRLIVSAVQVYGKLLEGAVLEELDLRVKALEEEKKF